ncbi:hypothetical protein CGC20_14610 [Leishmania donovani]|uniref:Uncharacterized protein n=1 Tax=Leishmania donovani TaxID=5661 RepID=A0A504XK86_LEIDO|nr:hypothetical protein CGC20_14610 [Leishmania donovani]
MPRVFARPCTSLSAFQMKPYSTMECGAERQTHDMLRHTVERLWHPFTQGYRGADLNIYRFRENLAGLCCPGNIFTCQVNGLLGGTRVLEDFFATLLSGFDIVHASVEGSRGKPLSNPADICNYTGYYVLAHTRPFLGWQPSPTSLRSTGPTSALPGTTIRSSVQYEFNGATPETARLSHVVLRTPVMELLRTRPECPEAVQKCLESREALKIFATLRRAGVKPELITATTLLSASKRDPAWMSALGIL